MMRQIAGGVAVLMSGLLAAPGSAHAQGAGAAPSVPAERTFRDWVVGCDNVRSCIALGLVPADDLDTAFLHVQRDAGRGARPVVSLVVYDEADKPENRQITLTIDGATIEDVASRRLAEAVPDFPGFLQASLSDGEVAPLVAALRRGKQLNIAVDGGSSASISLSGAMAALLFIDDVQGRVDSVGALARSGRRLASAIPEPPPLPLITARPALEGTPVDPRRAEAISNGWARQAARDCAVDGPEGSAAPEILGPLSDGRLLVGVHCDSGAYNFNSVFGIVQPGEPLRVQPAHFPLPAVDGTGPSGSSESLTNPDFEPADATIGFISKGRGFGDCGSSGTYTWTGAGFALSSWRSMPECRGVPEPYWPVLWRSREG